MTKNSFVTEVSFKTLITPENVFLNFFYFMENPCSGLEILDIAMGNIFFQKICVNWGTIVRTPPAFWVMGRGGGLAIFQNVHVGGT